MKTYDERIEAAEAACEQVLGSNDFTAYSIIRNVIPAFCDGDTLYREATLDEVNMDGAGYYHGPSITWIAAVPLQEKEQHG